MFVLKHKRISGYRMGQMTFYGVRHRGVDYYAYKDNLYAPFNGKIIKQYWGFQGGNWLHFLSDSGYLFKFAHLSRFLMKQGDYIKEGMIIAITGNTGAFTKSPHLHLEIWQGKKQINPETFNFNKGTIMVNKILLNQIFNELLCRLPDKEAESYIGKDEEFVRKEVGKSEECQLIINLINHARILN